MLSQLTAPQNTDRNILQVMAKLGGTGDHLTLSDPLLQLLNVLVELVQPVLLLQLGLPVLHHVLQGHVQPVYVRLLLCDLLTVENGEKTRQLLTVLFLYNPVW